MTAPSHDRVVPLRGRRRSPACRARSRSTSQPRQDPPCPPTAGRASGPGRRRDLDRGAAAPRRSSSGRAATPRPPSRSSAATARSPSCCAGARARSTQDLERRAQLVARAGRHQPGQGRVQPVRPQVLGVHTCFLTRDVVEVSAHVRYGERSRALAARFERSSRRWRCTALEFAWQRAARDDGGATVERVARSRAEACARARRTRTRSRQARSDRPGGRGTACTSCPSRRGTCRCGRTGELVLGVRRRCAP